MYGTTDVIVGGLSGDNALLNNDFNARGEYQGGPDGCAFDFETAATGFLVQGNTFYRSWGAGIMIFGHATTSHNLTIDANTFAYAGCVQNRNDKGGLAVMCPGGHKPSGKVTRNSFYTCENGNAPAIFVNPGVPGCASDLVMSGNRVDGNASALVAMPQLSFDPPPPTSTATQGTFKAIGVTATPGATIRYTLDGSRPTAASPVLPSDAGLALPFPGPVVAVNLRAFKTGMTPSVTNGAVVELNYGLGRSAPGHGDAGPNGARVGALGGNLDGVELHGGSNASCSGWAVDTLLPGGGTGPVTVVLSVDHAPVASVLALADRPDLPKAGVAPNAAHGFVVQLPAAAARALQGAGRHVLGAKVVGSPSSEFPRFLPEKHQIFVCDGKLC